MAASSLPVLAAVVAATAATTLDALPERIDVTSVLAAYGAGAVLGEAITVHEVEAQRDLRTALGPRGVGRDGHYLVSWRRCADARLTAVIDPQWRRVIFILMLLGAVIGAVASWLDFSVGAVYACLAVVILPVYAWDYRHTIRPGRHQPPAG